MSESKFTPGPWAVHKSFSCAVVPGGHERLSIGCAADPDDEARRFAKVIHREDGSKFSEFARSRVMQAEAKANSRLIAAAPEMYEQLCAFAAVLRITGAIDAAKDVDALLARIRGDEDPTP